MGQKISAPNTLRLLPQFMRKDEANIALAAAVDELLQDPGSRAKQLRVWDKIDELPESQLDELAWELNVDWYKTSMTIEAKRATIKNARLIKAHRGTKYAVEELVSNYLGSGVVVEWFEVNGKPYTFYICTTEDVEDDSKYNEFVEAANAAKSARSRLLGVYSYMEHTVRILAKHSGGAGAFVFIKAGTNPKIQNVGGLNRATAQSGPETIPSSFAYVKCGTRVCGI
jgi:phage tail P2-like protein